MPDDEDAPELTISSVLEHYGADLARARSHGWSTVRCPFHHDTHSSGRISLAKNGFWCPACGVKGDAIGIIMEQEGLNFREANEWAREVLGASKGHVRRADEKPRRKRWRNSLFD